MREAMVRLETNRRAKMNHRLLSVAELLQRACQICCEHRRYKDSGEALQINA